MTRRRRRVGDENESKTWGGDWDYTCVIVDVTVDGCYVERTTETTVDCKVIT